jgi:ATP-dependent exoDNAse (exonuclease V) beta subunit
MAWGTLIHGLLEHAMRHQGATREDLRRLAGWLTVENPELRQVMDLAVQTVQGVASASFWSEARSGVNAVEVPFATESVARRLVTGVIDLLYQSPDAAWHVIDYKTDAQLKPETLAAYQRQLDAYRAALAACGIAVLDANLTQIRGTAQHP